MRVYVSADIEGVAGIAHWNEADRSNADYAEFREQMTAEVAAACAGALEAGATDILVKDAHDSARNIIAARLPRETRLARGWSGHPFLMVEGLDASYGALVLVGYHSKAGSDANPLAHTITQSIALITVNGEPASEMRLHAYAAASVSVPLVFVSGDAGVCGEAQDLDPRISTVAVKEGLGSLVTSLHPALAVERIHDGVRDALRASRPNGAIRLASSFAVEITFRDHAKAYSASFYPGVRQVDPRRVGFQTGTWFDVLRTIAFLRRA